MTYQLVVINARGATMRTGPSTSGGVIRQIIQGEVLDVERLIFPKPQGFDTSFIPAFQEAQRKGLVIGDVWCQVAGLQTYHDNQVTGYVALRVLTTTYGVLAGAVDPKVQPLSNQDARIAEIDEMMRHLTVRRMELSG